MTATLDQITLLRRVRCAVALVIVVLVLSGVTAFPLQRELELATAIRGVDRQTPEQVSNGFDRWILIVRDGLRKSYARHPWLAYGTDWLAFAHIAIALFFVGPLIDPVRNVWVLRAGLIACVLIVPNALLCGAVRQIPIGWRLIDCSFGLFGTLPLCYSIRLTRALERISSAR